MKYLNAWWNWTRGGSKWRWAPSIIVGFFAVIIFIGIAFPAAEEEPDASAQGNDTPGVEAPAEASLDDDTPPPDTPVPVPASIEERIEESYRDNKNFMARASTDELLITFVADTGLLTISIEPDVIMNEADALTIASHSALVASRAIWRTYPEVARIQLLLYTGFTDQLGNSDTAVAASLTVGRETGDQMNFDGLKNRVISDNKHFFCLADDYLIHLAIYGEIDDTGCLRGPSSL